MLIETCPLIHTMISKLGGKFQITKTKRMQKRVTAIVNQLGGRVGEGWVDGWREQGGKNSRSLFDSTRETRLKR